MLGTGRLREQRSFAVLERLGEIAGTGPVWDEARASLSDAHRATAIVSAGETLLGFLIDALGESRGSSEVKRAWKALRPDPGARASVFLSHAMAAILGRLAEAPDHHLSADRQLAARKLVESHFPWPEDDARLVDELVSRLRDKERPQQEEVDTEIIFSFHALRIVLGDEATESLHGFEVLGEPGLETLAGLRLDVAWYRGEEEHLRLTDPDGLVRMTAAE